MEVWCVAIRGTVDLEEFDEVVLFLPAADTFQVEDFAEVGVVFVGDVDQVRLD